MKLGVVLLSQEIFKGIHLSSLVGHWPKAVLVALLQSLLGVIFLLLFSLLSGELPGNKRAPVFSLVVPMLLSALAVADGIAVLSR